MPLKIVATQVGTAKIVVENTWLHGAKLLVNGQEIAMNNAYFALSKKKPFMSAKVIVEGTEKLIEVFEYAPFFTVKIKICVDGKQIAGDHF